MRFSIAFVAAAIAASTMFVMPQCDAGYRLIEDTYTVQEGDTLDSITDVFIKKNTYGPREHYEFRSGIESLNYEKVKRGIREGDILRINYWIETGDDNG